MNQSYRSSWVYILKCRNGMYYTGCTTNLEQRLNQHYHGFFPGKTRNLRPVKLVFSEEFNDIDDIDDAIRMGRRIKGWTRVKKEALIQRDFKKLEKLSNLKKRRHPSTSSG
ncbi:GIY-YIG nuclease family protein [Fibrobacterota bacterium]